MLVSQTLKTHLNWQSCGFDSVIFEDVHGNFYCKIRQKKILFRHHLIKDLMERFEEYEKSTKKN